MDASFERGTTPLAHILYVGSGGALVKFLLPQRGKRDLQTGNAKPAAIHARM
jgi:hypothetical protein